MKSMNATFLVLVPKKGGMINAQKILIYTLINTGFEHFLCTNQPN